MIMIVKKDYKSDSKEKEGLDKTVAQKKSEINNLNEKNDFNKKTTNNINHSLLKSSIFTF